MGLPLRATDVGREPFDSCRNGGHAHEDEAILMDVDPPVEGAHGVTEERTTPDNLRGRVCAALGGGFSEPHAVADHASNGTEELDLRSDPGGTPRGVDAEGDACMSSAHGVDDGAIDEWFCGVGGCGHSRGDGRRGYATRQSVLPHVLSVHVSRGDDIPAAWFVETGVRLCSHCNIFVTRGEACVGPRCTHALLRSWEGRYDRSLVDEGVYAASLDGPAPSGGEAALEAVLGGKFPFHAGWRAGARTRLA